MSTASIIRQRGQGTPELMTVQRTGGQRCQTNAFPLDAPAKNGASQSLRFRYTANEAFVHTLLRDMLAKPTTFQLEWDGGRSTVTTTPIRGVGLVHIGADGYTGVISLGGDDESPAQAAAMGAVAAIVAIVGIAAAAIVATVALNVLTDDGSGGVEVGEGDGEGDGEGGGEGDGEGGGEG